MDAVTNVVLVIGSWSVFTLVVTSPGFVFRRLLVRLAGTSDSRSPRRADFWLGYAVVVAYLQLWSLIAPVDGLAWILPLGTVPALVLGVAASRRDLRTRVSAARGRLVTLGFAAAALLLVANRSIGKALDYDLGLYHLQAIEFSTRFAVIPGIGNLHDRLGNSNPHLLAATFLDAGPWNVLGYHLLNGWLLAALVVELAARVVRRGEGLLGFTTVLATVLPLALIPICMGAWDYRFASPNLDGAALVLVAAATLFLVQVFEDDEPFISLVTGLALLAVVAAQRPLYAAWLVAAAAVVLVRRRSLAGLGRARPWMVAALLPALLALGTIARQVIASGYPLFPLRVGRLPVDWAMPEGALSHYSEFVTRWARWPGNPEAATGLGWLGHWTSERLHDLSVMPAVLLLVVAAFLRLTRREGPGWSWDVGALIVVVAPGLATLALWFVTAPDPRFALPAIWLPTIAALAWTVPRARLPFGRPLGLALLAGLMVMVTAEQIGWDAIRPVNPRGGGALGIERPRVPRLVSWNVNGLDLGHPDGSDQCWAETSCTAYDPAGMRLRGEAVASGFSRR